MEKGSVADELRLTGRQRAFIEHYLESWNATDAARQVGYRNPEKLGPRNLKKPAIIVGITKRMEEQALKANEVLKRLADQARLNASDFFVFEEDPQTGKVVMTDVNWEIFRSRGHLIKGLKYSRQGKPVLEFYDAQAALEKIGRAMALFVDREEITQRTDNTEVRIYIPDNGRANG